MARVQLLSLRNRYMSIPRLGLSTVPQSGEGCPGKHFSLYLKILSQALVAHICNQLLRRQISGGSKFKTSPANSLQDPILKKNRHKKKGWWSGSR
jgi:hypothetical protein